jgi:hypothetical protein
MQPKQLNYTWQATWQTVGKVAGSMSTTRTMIIPAVIDCLN